MVELDLNIVDAILYELLIVKRTKKIIDDISVFDISKIDISELDNKINDALSDITLEDTIEYKRKHNLRDSVLDNFFLKKFLSSHTEGIGDRKVLNGNDLWNTVMYFEDKYGTICIDEHDEEIMELDGEDAFYLLLNNLTCELYIDDEEEDSMYSYRGILSEIQVVEEGFLKQVLKRIKTSTDVEEKNFLTSYLKTLIYILYDEELISISNDYNQVLTCKIDRWIDSKRELHYKMLCATELILKKKGIESILKITEVS